MPPPAPPLPDELLEEIFLRLPPDEPACLVHASLASKLWLGLLAGPSFCGRYRELHGAPPMLGFFYSWAPYSGAAGEEPDPLFVSTTKFGACIPYDDEDWCYYGYEPWDRRHGRAVLGDRDASPTKLVVLDPMKGHWSELDTPKDHDSHGAAVLCNVTGCDHLACPEGPFKVVVVGMDIGNGDSVAHAYVSLPGTGELSRPISRWSNPSSGLHIGSDAFIQPMPPVLIQDTLYFMLVYDDDDHVGILKYDLCSQCLSLIDAPLTETDIARFTILMGMKDGSLGFAHLDGLNLNLWSRQMGSDGVGSWTECRVIDLKEFLPIQNPEKSLRLMGSSEGRDIIFVSTDLGIYEINLKSLEWKKIWNRENFCALVPYMSFYDPSMREDDLL